MRKRILHSIAVLLVSSGWVAGQTPAPLPFEPASPPTNITPVPTPALTSPIVDPVPPSVSLQPPTLPSGDLPLSGLPLSALPDYPSEPVARRTGRRTSTPQVEESLTEETPGPAEEGPEFPRLIDFINRMNVTNFQLYNQSERVYFSADYLYYWTKDNHLPTLASAGNAANAIPGALGQAGTQNLFTNADSSVPAQSGFRARLGYWVPSEVSRALEVNYFFLGRGRSSFTANSDGTALLARPFFHATTNVENAFVVVTPGTQRGGINIDFTSRLSGFDVNLKNELWYSEDCRFDWLLGFRHLELIENLDINTQTDNIPPLPAGTLFRSISMREHFGTANYFYGAQLGVESQINLGRFVLTMEGKVAIGDSHEKLNVVGRTDFVSATGRATSASGGLLASRSNVGSFTEDQFAVIPEVGFAVGYQVATCCRLQLGYNFLYWSNVLRPGDQVDRVVNPTQLPFPLGAGALGNPARPAHFSSADTDFWAQGITASLLFKF